MPATEMYTLLLREQGRDYWRDHIANGIDEPIPRPLCSMTDREIQLDAFGLFAILLQTKANCSFLSRIKSRDALSRSVNSCSKCLLSIQKQKLEWKWLAKENP